MPRTTNANVTQEQNSGNDVPLAQAQQEGQTNTNVREQGSSQNNQDNSQGGGFFFQQGNQHFNYGVKKECYEPSFSFANVADARELNMHDFKHQLKEDLTFGCISHHSIR